MSLALTRDRYLQAPNGGNLFVGTMSMVLAAAAATMFSMRMSLACLFAYGRPKSA